MSDDSTGRILAAIAQIDGRMAQLEGNMTQLGTDMTQLRGDVTQLSGDMTQLRGDVTQLSGDVTRLHGDMTQMRGDMTQMRTGMMQRIDRLQNTFASMKEDIVVNFGNTERVERAAHGFHIETRALAEVVTAMQRQIRTLTDRVDGIELRGNGQAKQG